MAGVQLVLAGITFVLSMFSRSLFVWYADKLSY